MNRLLIYISYDSYEYMNYFHLAVNGIVSKCIKEEEIQQQLGDIKNEQFLESEVECCVVKDKDAYEWKYESVLKDVGFKVRPAQLNESELCDMMKNLFDDSFTLKENENGNEKIITLLYPTSFVSTVQPQTMHNDAVEVKKTVIDISSKEEKTGIATIIEEKYERIKKDE